MMKQRKQPLRTCIACKAGADKRALVRFVRIKDSQSADAPGTDASGIDATGIDASGMDAQGMDASGMDVPNTDAPGTDASGIDASGMDAQGMDTPGMSVPDAEMRGVETLAIGTPDTEMRGVETPALVQEFIHVRLDPTGRMAGRGAYVCAHEECFERARRNRAFERALRCPITPAEYERLASEFVNLCAAKHHSVGTVIHG